MLMRTEKRVRREHVLVLLVAFIVLLAARAGGQQQFELPQQSSQSPGPNYSRSAPAPTPVPELAPGSDVRTLPQVSPQSSASVPSSSFQAPAYSPQAIPTSPPAGSDKVVPVLPAIFRGCWEGRVDYVDSLEPLPGGPRLGFWTPKTYRLCYRRVGNGPFVLTFTEAGIEQSDRITNVDGQLTLLSSDGRRYASMRSDLDFDEYTAPASYFGRNTFAVHEVADLNCTIEQDGMHVISMVTGWRNDVPWFRARWHTIFIHQGEPPQQVEAPPGGIPE
jgi:hypothetical protein